ncbi:MAG: matrixin family metalloprotease [Patescibacteria group bacterium]|nr:matrixin family metalloprotease [Patescibacteria group bacterium]
MKLVMVFVPVVLAAMFASLMPQSFADGFEQPLFKWAYQPSICVLEPSDSNFPGLGQKMFIQTQNAVLDWQTKLNGGNAKNGAWNFKLIDIPFSQTNSYNATNCDITVNFKPSPNNPDEKFNEAGITVYKNFPKVYVTIYYLGVDMREQYETFWQNGTHYYTYQPIPYFTGYLASDPQLEMTIRHELGHSLGLGHYIVSDAALTKIVEGDQDMPSIMVTTVFTYGVTHFDITPLDIKEVQSIYGTRGLGAKPLPVQNITQNIVPTAVAAVPPILNQTQTVQNVPSQIPAWIKHIAKWWSLNQVSNGEFTDAMKYLIEQGILKVPGTANYVSSSQIPTWVTTNAGYWADGKISDYEFIRGIQYLISDGMIALQ